MGSRPSDGEARLSIWPKLLLLIGLAIVGVAAYLDYKWTPAKERGGPDTALVVLVLGLLALTLPAVRERLAEVKSFKAAGIEVSLGAVTGAADDEVRALTDVRGIGDPDPELAKEGPEVEREPRVVDSVAASNAPRAIAQLRRRLSERVDWIWDNVPNLGVRPATETAVERLHELDFLPSAQAQLLRAVVEVSPDAIRRSDAAIVERFIAQADAVVHTLRLIVFDRYVRALLRHGGYVLVDWQPQPRPQRWPDLLAHGEGPMAQPEARGTFWIAVRVALRADSTLYENTRARLASPRWQSEVPGGPEATRLIVVPDASAVDLRPRDGVEGVRGSDLLARLRQA